MGLAPKMVRFLSLLLNMNKTNLISLDYIIFQKSIQKQPVLLLTILYIFLVSKCVSCFWLQTSKIILAGFLDILLKQFCMSKIDHFLLKTAIKHLNKEVKNEYVLRNTFYKLQLSINNLIKFLKMITFFPQCGIQLDEFKGELKKITMKFLNKYLCVYISEKVKIY